MLLSKDYRDLSALMGEAQISFRKLHFYDFIRELAPRNTSNNFKIQLPQYFESMFPTDCALSVTSVSGKKYSFWHALMSVLLPNFILTSWMIRKIQVENLLEELAMLAPYFFKKNYYISNTTLSHEDIKYRDDIPSTTLQYYICCLFDINLIIVSNIDTQFSYCEPIFNVKKPTIVLYHNDCPIFYPISINDETLFATDIGDIFHLIKKAPKENMILRDFTTIKSKFYAQANSLSKEDIYKQKHKSDLEALNQPELKELGKKYGISCMKPSAKTGKLIFKSKAELTEEILCEANKSAM